MTVALFNLTLDPSIGKTDKKIGMEAVTVVKKVLINAGMDEGDWVLRDAKRITKKGHQKFKVIRVESRGGAKYIRLWCKPRGNDTSYEYSLVPPHGVDVERLFLLLQRTNSVSLEIPESLELPIAVFDRIVEAKPKFRPLPKVQVLNVDLEKDKKRKERIAEWQIEDLELSPKIQSSLKESGLKTVGDLCVCTTYDLIEFGISEKEIDDIKKELSNFDLNLTNFDLKTKEKSLLDTPIADLRLCVLSCHGLSKCGIKTLGELIAKSEQEIRSIKNFGDSNVKEIKNALTSRGLSLKVEGLPTATNGREIDEQHKGGDQTEADRQIVLAICEKFSDPMDRVRAWREWKEKERRGSTGEDIRATNTEIAKELKQKPTNIEKISSLLVVEPMMLFEQEAMDKSLLAIAMVSINGYVRRVASSSSIIENLGIKNFVENICEGRYTTTESAMKSLMTALKNNNYIERVRCSPRDGGHVSDGVRGYKLTPKAEKRIEALLARCEESISSKIISGWGKRSTGSKNTTEETQSIFESEQPALSEVDLLEADSSDVSESTDVEPAETESILDSDTIGKLKNLISNHEKALAEINEANLLIKNLIEEKKELSISQTGFRLAEEACSRQIEEMKKELEIIQSKRKTIQQDINKKESEIENWESYKAPFMEDQAKIEKEISRLTGRSKI